MLWKKLAMTRTKRESVESRSLVLLHDRLPCCPHHSPQRGPYDSGSFCWPHLSPSALSRTGKGRRLESRRAWSGPLTPVSHGEQQCEHNPGLLWAQYSVTLEGKKINSRKMTFETKQGWSVFGLASQCHKHLDNKIVMTIMMIMIIVHVYWGHICRALC